MGIFSKFKQGLKKTRDEGITAQMDEVIESYDKICDELFDELEEILIMGDVGIPTAERIITDLKSKIANDGITSVPEVRETMKDIVSGIVWGGSYLKLRTKPSVLLIIGVNGVGKTTTIGKLALRLKEQDRKVVLGAADTFRAAAIEQLQVWADRAGVDLIKHAEGADPAAVVYDTIQAGKARNADVIIIDTAGRLHNKKNLMDELNKISRVIERELPDSSKEVLLVLDATTGQNAVNQAKDFKEAAGITGIILTKLDGTAKGGVILAINNELDVPVKFVGVGESIDDLQPFDADAFASALFDAKIPEDDRDIVEFITNEGTQAETDGE
jgi:fused signal recognition particle receptor